MITKANSDLSHKKAQKHKKQRVGIASIFVLCFCAFLWLSKSFRDTTAGANEPPPVFLINPLRQRRTLLMLGAVMVMAVMFALRGLCAAVFTEPAITQIEEVGRLVHRS